MSAADGCLKTIDGKTYLLRGFEHVQCGLSYVAGSSMSPDTVFLCFLHECQIQNESILRVCRKHKGSEHVPDPHNPPGREVTHHSTIGHLAHNLLSNSYVFLLQVLIGEKPLIIN